jgi:hypothetical protein
MTRAFWAVALAAAVAARAEAQQQGDTAADAARQQAGAARDDAAGAARQAGDAAGQAADATGDAARAGAERAQGAATRAGNELRQDAPLADRCVALMRGQLDPAQRADVGPRCEDLVRAGASRQGGPAAGAGTEAPQAGEAVRTAFTNAASELTGSKRSALGATSRGDVWNTLVTNPLGWFSGLGVNAEYSRPFEDLDKFSWVAAARYARANATNGNITSFGLGAGADFFLYGHNNEGIRIGPRLELALGSESVQGSTTFARLGLAGEVGYNFIASSGLSAQVAGGIGGRIAGDSKNDENFASFTGGALGPYLKLGIGFSW